MYNKEMLIQDLQEMGLQPTDALMVHSSMKAIGEVEGGADTVVDALLAYFKEGLVMVPAHTWKQMSAQHNVFDPQAEPACVGIIPNIFMQRPGVVRSLHPTHSIAAYGNAAAQYVQGEEELTTPCAPGGAWDRLRDIHAKILLVGVTHARNTFIHSVEEVFDVPERFTAEPTAFWVKMHDGSLKRVEMYRHYNKHTAHISESFDKLMECYFETKAACRGKLGDAECILCEADKLFEVTGRVLMHEKNCLIERDDIPKEWYR